MKVNPVYFVRLLRLFAAISISASHSSLFFAVSFAAPSLRHPRGILRHTWSLRRGSMSHEHLRRPDRRRRPVRHRRGLSPADATARTDLRDPRGARRHRRHLGSVPLSRHPLRLRHVHARLFVRPWTDAEGDRRRPVDPRATCGRPRASTASIGTSASATACARASWSTPKRALDGRGRARPNGEIGALHLQLPLHVQRLLRLRRRLHARVPGRRSASAAAIVHPQNGPRTSTTRASASS